MDLLEASAVAHAARKLHFHPFPDIERYLLMLGYLFLKGELRIEQVDTLTMMWLVSVGNIEVPLLKLEPWPKPKFIIKNMECTWSFEGEIRESEPFIIWRKTSTDKTTVVWSGADAIKA
jgi:hypothetical protein